MRISIKPLFVFIMLSVLIIGGSCKSHRRPSKAVRETEKRQEEQAERQAAEYEEAKERHMEIQTKETKERMKAMQKKSARYNYNKREFFLVRWWKKIFHKNRRVPRRGGN